MWSHSTGRGKPYFLHESISQPEFLFLSILVMFVLLFIPDAESGSNLNSWLMLSVSVPCRRGGRCVWLMKKQPKTETNTGSFFFFCEVCLVIGGVSEEKSTAALGPRSQLLWSCLLYLGVCDPDPVCSFVLFCLNETRNFQTLVWGWEENREGWLIRK